VTFKERIGITLILLAALVALVLLGVIGCATGRRAPFHPPPGSPWPTTSVAGPPAPARSQSDPRPSPAIDVMPGAFCPVPGRLGYTEEGELMRCAATDSDPRPRWRRA
jgi:hypothetical protein